MSETRSVPRSGRRTDERYSETIVAHLRSLPSTTRVPVYRLTDSRDGLLVGGHRGPVRTGTGGESCGGILIRESEYVRLRESPESESPNPTGSPYSSPSPLGPPVSVSVRCRPSEVGSWRHSLLLSMNTLREGRRPPGTRLQVQW